MGRSEKNPELSAMERIWQTLDGLPDETARNRVLAHTWNRYFTSPIAVPVAGGKSLQFLNGEEGR